MPPLDAAGANDWVTAPAPASTAAEAPTARANAAGSGLNDWISAPGAANGPAEPTVPQATNAAPPPPNASQPPSDQMPEESSSAVTAPDAAPMSTLDLLKAGRLDQSSLAARVGNAVLSGYRNAPELLTPEGNAALAKIDADTPHPNLTDLVHIGNAVMGAGNAVFSGGVEGIAALGEAVGEPGLGHDVAGYLQSGGAMDIAPLAPDAGAAIGHVADAGAAAAADAIAAIGKAPDVDSAIAAASKAAATPTAVADGAVRFYHGGNDRGPQSNWVTPDLAYAQGYAQQNGGGVHYVDVPQDHPAPIKMFDDSGSDVKSPYGNFEAPPDIAQRLQPYGAAPEDGAGAPAPAGGAATTPGPPSAAVASDSASAASPSAPKTSADAKKIASAYYQQADAIGGTLLPEFTNKFIDAAESVAPQTPEGRAIAGDTAVTGLVVRLQTLRDQPISLQGAQEIDERLGDLVDQQFGLKGLSKEGHNLLDLQTTFRNMILDATPADTTGGTAGFEAIQQGRVAWAQAMKMTDLERILNRAEQTDNPVTSIRTGVRALTSNPARIRGYTPEEVAALKDAANRGALGSVLHVFGSRLAPLAIGAVGMSHGLLPGLIEGGGAHVITSGLRNWATSIQAGRAGDAMAVLGKGVPPPPEASPAVRPGAAASAEAPTAVSPESIVQTQLQREQAAVSAMKARASAPVVTAVTPQSEAGPAPRVTAAQVQRRDGVGYNEAARRADVENAATSKPSQPGNLYASTTAVTPAGRPVAVRYAVREASDLTPSQLPDGRPNPAFPQELQPRDRTRAASTTQVANIASNLTPERLGYASDTATGAPVVGPDGIVESGNGRTMAIQKAYAEGSTQADSYRAWLAGQGFDISGTKHPVLVRERTAPMGMEDRARLADEMGASPTMGMAAPERAAADAKRIPADALSMIQRGDVTSQSNAPFVRAFAAHAVPASEQANFMTAGGDLSVEGATRVRNALTQRAYGSNALMTSLAEDADPDLKAFGGALVDAAGPMAKLRGAIEAGAISPSNDISPALIQAGNLIKTARRAKISLADAAAQTDAFSQIYPRTEEIVRVAFGDDLTGRMSRAKLAGKLANFADKMQQQSGLFGTNMNADQILRELVGKQ